MAGRVPSCITISRASADALWRAEQAGTEAPSLEMEITWTDNCTPEQERRWALWMLKMRGIEPQMMTEEEIKDEIMVFEGYGHRQAQ